MTKMEYLEAGYTVVHGSPYGDMVLDAEGCEAYEGYGELISIDEEKKEVYFYDEIWA